MNRAGPVWSPMDVRMLSVGTRHCHTHGPGIAMDDYRSPPAGTRRGSEATPLKPRPTAVPQPRRWRDYRTASGQRPVHRFITGLSDDDALAVAAGMKDVALNGLVAARHLRGDIYEVRAEGRRATFRVLFAPEGSRGRVLLALEAFSKKSQQTPAHTISLAERRLADWRSRRVIPPSLTRPLGISLEA
ncbi:MAG: type II toxin-antitoxin system RelE/ParE family toxin [Candidatus Dormibacteria bacterium]